MKRAILKFNTTLSLLVAVRSEWASPDVMAEKLTRISQTQYQALGNEIRKHMRVRDKRADRQIDSILNDFFKSIYEYLCRTPSVNMSLLSGFSIEGSQLVSDSDIEVKFIRHISELTGRLKDQNTQNNQEEMKRLRTERQRRFQIEKIRRYRSQQIAMARKFQELPESQSEIFQEAKAYFDSLNTKSRQSEMTFEAVEDIFSKSRRHVLAAKYASKVDEFETTLNQRIQDLLGLGSTSIEIVIVSTASHYILDEIRGKLATYQRGDESVILSSIVPSHNFIESAISKVITNKEFIALKKRLKFIKVTPSMIKKHAQGAANKDEFLSRLNGFLAEDVARSLLSEESSRSSMSKKNHKRSREETKASKSSEATEIAVSARVKSPADVTENTAKKIEVAKSEPSLIDQIKGCMGLDSSRDDGVILRRLQEHIAQSRDERICHERTKIRLEEKVLDLECRIRDIKSDFEEKKSQSSREKGQSSLDDFCMRLHATLGICDEIIEPHALLWKAREISDSYRKLAEEYPNKDKEILSLKSANKALKNMNQSLSVDIEKQRMHVSALSRDIKEKLSRIASLESELKVRKGCSISKLHPKTPPLLTKKSVKIHQAVCMPVQRPISTSHFGFEYHASVILDLQARLADPVVTEFFRCIEETPSLGLRSVVCKVPDLVPAMWNDIDITLAIENPFSTYESAILSLNERLKTAGFSVSFPFRSRAENSRLTLTPESHPTPIDVSIAKPTEAIFKTGIRVILDPRHPAHIDHRQVQVLDVPVNPSDFFKTRSGSRPIYETDLTHIIKSFIRVLQKRALHRGELYTDQNLYRLMISEINVLETMLIATKSHIDPAKNCSIDHFRFTLPIILSTIIDERSKASRSIFRKQYLDLKSELPHIAIDSPLCSSIIDAISTADRKYWAEKGSSSHQKLGFKGCGNSSFH